MTRVFVTGASGLLGSTVVPYLQSRHYEVVCAPSRASSVDSSDLSIARNATALLDAAKPNVILNLAALTNVDQCEQNPGEAYRINAGVVLNLADWIRANGGQCRLIQCSTDQVYDGVGPHAEDRICPINYYGYSKCVAEEYARAVGGTILRANFIGKSRRAGRQSLSDWVVSSLRKRAAITVFDDVLFSPLSLEKLTDMIERTIATPIPGIFNVGSRGGMSKAEFTFQLAAAVGLPTDSVTRGTLANAPRMAARRPLDMRMDLARFETAFGCRMPEFSEEIRIVGGDYRNERV